MFTFTPLLGARASSPAVQSLLEFDGGIKILIDVGWDVTFNADALKELEKQVPTISIILLTHATLSHVGAYAHCCKHVPLFKKIPVYATTPVISLTRTLLQDLYTSSPLAASFIPESSLAESAYTFASATSKNPNILLSPPTPQEIEEYLKLANQLKYSQPHQPIPSSFSPPLDGLTITAYCAGHSLGGTIWQIQYGSESIVYAVDWHQARENVFPGAAWLSAGAEVVEQLRQPTALICSSRGSGIISASGSRQQRDEQLLAKVRAAVRDGGNVLIPCDTSARVLEIAYILDRAWTQDKVGSADSLQKAKLYMASSTSSLTMRYARSMLEWMDENIIREFEASNSGKGQATPTQPFDFRHLKLVERKSQLDRALHTQGPKVILASDASLEWGFSRQLLQNFAAMEGNLILLPTSTIVATDGTFLARMWDLLRKHSGTNETSNETIQLKSETLKLRQVQTSPLAGQDQSIYQQYLARQRQRQSTTTTNEDETLETSADAVEERSESSSSSDEESDNEQQGKALNASATLTHSKNKIGLTDEELGVNVLVRKKNVHDFDVRGKKGRDKMFPFVAKRKRNDEFGDLIRPEEYLRAEERDETDGQDMATTAAKTNAALGRKRKWGDTDDAADQGKKKAAMARNKRRKGKGGADVPAPTTNGTDGAAGDAASESEESDYEPAEAIVRGPMKATFTTDTIQLKMKITSVDFSGIHDQRSLQMLIPLIKPRKLILTAGTQSETLSLANTCRSLLANTHVDAAKADEDKVFTPAMGETVDASVDTNAWTIKLSQKLFRQLQWQTFRNLGIVTINGRLELVSNANSDASDAKRQKVEQSEGAPKNTAEDVAAEESSPVLNDLPVNLSGPTRLANQPLHVGDLRLAELRRIMQSNGHTAEFKGEGTLLVDGIIAVRKSGIGKIEVESGGAIVPGAAPGRHPGASFYNVKKKIYEGLAVVAAR